MTIRTRLTLWFVLVGFSIFLLVDMVLFLGMRKLLYDSLDDDLNRFANQIETRQHPGRSTFTDILLRLQADKDFDELYVIVYNPEQKPIFASPLTEYFNLDIPFAPDEAQTGYTLKSIPLVNIPFLSPEGTTKIAFRAISRRMYHDGQFSGWIQAALPIISVQKGMNRLLRVMFVVNVLAALLLAAGGYLFTARALQPIKKIIEETNQISHSNLSDRLPIENPADEIGKLSATLNELLERLQRAFASQKEFLADAAHEMKTPMASLRSRLEELLYHPELPEKISLEISHDLQTLARMNGLIGNLLFLSRTEAVDEVFIYQPLDLHTLLLELTEEMRLLAGPHQQQIEYQSDGKLEMIGDRQRLYQLFFNLLDNAVKYSGEKSKIAVSLKLAPNSMAAITISDDGPGIASHHLARLFDRFYRVDKTRSRKAGGSGLGLSICKFIAEGHGGAISVQGQVELGTAFRVELPVLKQKSGSV